jgi:hypothetical protein
LVAGLFWTDAAFAAKEILRELTDLGEAQRRPADDEIQRLEHNMGSANIALGAK